MIRSLYPADWESIALHVKSNAGWKCVHCGRQCRRPGEPFDTHVRTLTVAHLNHEPADCSAANLRALCSGCHLRYDAPEKARKRKQSTHKET